jgi:hypothetical protein
MLFRVLKEMQCQSAKVATSRNQAQSRRLILASLFSLLLDPEVGGSTFFRNSELPPDHTALPRRVYIYNTPVLYEMVTYPLYQNVLPSLKIVTHCSSKIILCTRVHKPNRLIKLQLRTNSFKHYSKFK